MWRKSNCESPSDCADLDYVSDIVYDLGNVLKPSMSGEEIYSSVVVVCRKFLTDHYIPSSNFMFPKVFNNGCNQYKWLEKFPWLVLLNGGFCKYHALFARERSKYGVLVNKLFEMCVKVHKVMDGHASY